MTYNRNLIRASRKIFQLLGAQAVAPSKKDYRKNVFDPQEGNDLIRKAISSGKPFLAARLGSTELSVLQNYLESQELKTANAFELFIKQSRGYELGWREIVRHNIQFYSGFFPATDSMLEKFSTEFLTDLKEVDLLGIWYNHFEDIIANRFCNNADLAELTSLEPYYHNTPWSAALKGKKVLVIHPFELSIQHQFAKREFIFPGAEILPDFELLTIKAIQTIAGSTTNFKSWFDALKYMADKISSCEFDVAIIGAGAYGLPLGSIVKRIGKQAIHLGGATQILFGIKGGRWDQMPEISALYNQYWVRPGGSEKPTLFEKIENGCYW